MNIAKAWTAQLDDYAIDLAWSADGRLLAAASASGPISVFDATGGGGIYAGPLGPIEVTNGK